MKPSKIILHPPTNREVPLIAVEDIPSGTAFTGSLSVGFNIWTGLFLRFDTGLLMLEPMLGEDRFGGSRFFDIEYHRDVRVSNFRQVDLEITIIDPV